MKERFMDRKMVARELCRIAARMIEAKVEYGIQSLGGVKAHLVITGIDDPTPDSDEVVEAVYNLRRALRKNRKHVVKAGLDPDNLGKARLLRYSIVIPIPILNPLVSLDEMNAAMRPVWRSLR